MPIAARLDELGKPAWIALMVLGFIVFWPLGLAMLFFLIGSGRMGCRYPGSDRWNHKMERLQQKLDWMKGRADERGFGFGGSQGPFGGRGPSAGSSGNSAFDEYRADTLKRLEQEQQEFKDFLERLRFAKDKTEFDAFMAERRNRPADPPAAPTQG